jgi:cytochrome oxidase Cu insertion factor (SCO1/SenC/PrrC family)
VKFQKIKLNLAMALLTVILSSGCLYAKADISKAFPNMSNVFEHVVFYNQDGELVNFKEHKDKVLLVFFGYTQCPDVCPPTVLDRARVLEGLGEDSENVLPVFIRI